MQDSEGEVEKETEPEETVPDDISANTSSRSSDTIPTSEELTRQRDQGVTGILVDKKT